MADPTKEQTKAPIMARGTVAKGRTVCVATDQKRVASYTAENKPIYRSIEKAFSPGQEVTLPEDEILRLRIAGFLIDPDAIPAVTGIGPNYDR